MEIKASNIIQRSGVDRRQELKPVEFENRSGIDRRLEPEKWKAHQESLFKLPEKVETGLRLCPPTRKVISALEGKGSGNLAYAGGMLYRGINECVEDFKDVKSALIPGLKQVENYDKQHPFWAVQGSLIEKTKVGKFLVNYDKTLFGYNPVKKILVKTGMTGYEVTESGLYKLEGSAISKVLGGAALRIPILGAGLFACMEAPNIFKAADKPKEVLKSGIKIATIMGLSALFGCVGRHYGKIVEMVLMGIGIMTGGKLSGKINSKI